MNVYLECVNKSQQSAYWKKKTGKYHKHHEVQKNYIIFVILLINSLTQLYNT